MFVLLSVSTTVVGLELSIAREVVKGFPLNAVTNVATVPSRVIPSFRTGVMMLASLLAGMPTSEEI